MHFMTKQYLKATKKLKNHALQYFLFWRKNNSFSMTKLLEHSVTQPTEQKKILKALAWVKLYLILLFTLYESPEI